MWDGNPNSHRNLVNDSCYWLSENQCGMETESSPESNHDRLVEREPMWDGNTYKNSPRSCFLIVEREPMWDGNKNIIVDGMKFVGLSENQCGMETERGTRRFLPHRLSENQCGMET